MGKTISTAYVTDKINRISVDSSLKCNSSNYTNNSSRSISYVVMHYTGNSKDTGKANANYFTGANRSASAHFFVDNTDIYQSVELRDAAWHCGASSYKHSSCRNANSIGIEMCCTAGNYKISDTTKKNAAYLCAYLCGILGITEKNVDTYVLRHYDVTGKECPAQMAGNNNSEWSEFKQMVKNILNGKSAATSSASTTTSTTSTNKLYRIRKSWEDASSQIGAYSNLENAIKDWKAGYYIYDWNGKQVYPEAKVQCSTVTPDVELPMIQKGCTGVAVKVLQTILGTTVTGTFNDTDVKSFKEFQKNTNQTQDGICGKNGWKAIGDHLCANTYKS